MSTESVDPHWGTTEGRTGSSDDYSGSGDASGLSGEMVRVHWIPPELIRDLARPTIAELSGGTDLTPYVRDIEVGGPPGWVDVPQESMLTRTITGPVIRMRIESWAEIDGRWEKGLDQLRAYLDRVKSRRSTRLHTAYRAKTRRRNRRNR